MGHQAVPVAPPVPDRGTAPQNGARSADREPAPRLNVLICRGLHGSARCGKHDLDAETVRARPGAYCCDDSVEVLESMGTEVGDVVEVWPDFIIIDPEPVEPEDSRASREPVLYHAEGFVDGVVIL